MPSLIYFALFTVAGIILIANPGFIISIFPIIAGVMIAVSGASGYGHSNGAVPQYDPQRRLGSYPL